jgi:hypothetical protein
VLCAAGLLAAVEPQAAFELARHSLQPAVDTETNASPSTADV